MTTGVLDDSVQMLRSAENVVWDALLKGHSINTSSAYFGLVMYEEGISDKAACASNVPLVKERASRGCSELLRYSS